MNIAKTVRMFAIFLALTFWAGTASAQSTSGQAGSPDLASLDQAIALDREARPEIYAAVESVRLQAPDVDRMKRGRLAVMGPAFQSLGPEATLALADALLDDAGFDSKQPPSVRQAWRVGMLNALRHWRDPAVRPALEELLQRPERDYVVLRATAEALGMLMDDRAADVLIGEITGEDDRSLTIASALSMCRRATVAQFLAGKLSNSEGGKARSVYLEATGDVANVWAWETAPVAASGESLETRTIARDALLAFYMEHDGVYAKEAMKGILLANVDSTEDVLRKMRIDATEGERAKIDFLSERVRNNPLNRRR